MTRTARRHCLSNEVNAFFHGHREALQRRGSSLFETRRVSMDNGALFYSWIELMVSRLGEEGQLAVELVQPSPTLRRVATRMIENARDALRRRRGVSGWLKQALPRAEAWLQVLAARP